MSARIRHASSTDISIPALSLEPDRPVLHLSGTDIGGLNLTDPREPGRFGLGGGEQRLHAQAVAVDARGAARALAVLTGFVAVPAADATPAHWVEQEKNGATVGVDLPCSEPPAHIVATIRWSNSKAATLSDDSCTSNPQEELGEIGLLKWSRSSVALSWGAEPSALTTGIGPRLVIEARSHSRNVKWTISFRLTANGSYLESGTILMHSEYWPTKRISQGEEAFVKYCLDKSREITSVDNRLGCYEPALKYVRTTCGGHTTRAWGPRKQP